MLLGLGIAGTDSFGPADAEFWVLALLVLVGELFPIQVHGQVGEETFSTPFAFALLLAYGLPEAVAVQVVASLIADVARRRPADRIVFNLAQIAISWVVAGLALEAVGGIDLGRGADLELSDLPAITLAAVVFFAANSTLVRAAEALLEQGSIADHLRDDLCSAAGPPPRCSRSARPSS